MIYTDDGLVVLFYYQPIPKQIKAGGKTYFFDCQHGVSLAFVNENEVDALVNATGGCCGRKRKIISLANINQYEHWKNGKGGRN